MTDPSNAELERRILAGLSLGSTYAEASAALSELCRRLGDLDEDRERLDLLERLCFQEGPISSATDRLLDRMEEAGAKHGSIRAALDVGRKEPPDAD